jgi:hypothetical protein
LPPKRRARLIAKLIKAGYLRAALRDDPAAVANAIARLKQVGLDNGENDSLSSMGAY